RGLGFDKPKNRSKHLPYAYSASAATYGHTGFSGTCIWVDPQHDLIFILLSNRIHPNRSNRQLARRGIRSKMHQAVYDAMGSFPLEAVQQELSSVGL
ncbi:MAG: serine hydrolase, partial [Bacteroidota bacterium]